MKKITPVEHDFYKNNIGKLMELYPTIFCKELPSILEIGIDKQLLTLTDFNKKEISCLLKVWCSRHEYTLMALSPFNQRISLIRGELMEVNFSAFNPKHLPHYLQRLKSIKNHRIKTFEENFYLHFNGDAFQNIPDKLNPRSREGYKACDNLKPTADLRHVNVFTVGRERDGEQYQYATGLISGHKKHNNLSAHRTSEISKIKKLRNVNIIYTDSEIYRVIGGIN